MSAELRRGKQLVHDTTLEYAGTVSTFAGTLVTNEPGQYELRVVASQADEANFGMASRRVTIR